MKYSLFNLYRPDVKFEDLDDYCYYGGHADKAKERYEYLRTPDTPLQIQLEERGACLSGRMWAGKKDLQEVVEQCPSIF